METRTLILLTGLILITGCTSESCLSVNGKCTQNEVEYFPHCEGNALVTYSCEDMACVPNQTACMENETCVEKNESGELTAGCEEDSIMPQTPSKENETQTLPPVQDNETNMITDPDFEVNVITEVDDPTFKDLVCMTPDAAYVIYVISDGFPGYGGDTTHIRKVNLATGEDTIIAEDGEWEIEKLYPPLFSDDGSTVVYLIEEEEEKAEYIGINQDTKIAVTVDDLSTEDYPLNEEEVESIEIVLKGMLSDGRILAYVDLTLVSSYSPSLYILIDPLDESVTQIWHPPLVVTEDDPSAKFSKYDKFLMHITSTGTGLILSVENWIEHTLALYNYDPETREMSLISEYTGELIAISSDGSRILMESPSIIAEDILVDGSVQKNVSKPDAELDFFSVGYSKDLSFKIQGESNGFDPVAVWFTDLVNDIHYRVDAGVVKDISLHSCSPISGDGKKLAYICGETFDPQVCLVELKN